MFKRQVPKLLFDLRKIGYFCRRISDSSLELSQKRTAENKSFLNDLQKAFGVVVATARDLASAKAK